MTITNRLVPDNSSCEEMGNVNSEQKRSSTLQFSFQSADSVIRSRGDVKAQGPMAVKIGNKTVSVTRPSNVFWVGVLLKKNGWIHTGVGLRNDITVRFTDGETEIYNYVVAHGVAGEDDKKFKIHLSFANNLTDIYDCLAQAFSSELDESFSPVLAGNYWTTTKLSEDIITRVEHFLGLGFNMKSPGKDETNCVHFSVVMYLFLANKESRQSLVFLRVQRYVESKEYRVLLTKIKAELNSVDDEPDCIVM